MKSKEFFEKEIENLATEFFSIDKNDNSKKSTWLKIRNEFCEKLCNYAPMQYPEKNEILEEVLSEVIMKAFKNFKSSLETDGKFLNYFNTILMNDVKNLKNRKRQESKKFVKNEITNSKGNKQDIFDFISDPHSTEYDMVKRNIYKNIFDEINEVYKLDTNRKNSNKQWKAAIYTHKTLECLRIFLFTTREKYFYDFVYSGIVLSKKESFSQKDVADLFCFDKSAYNSAEKSFYKLCRSNTKLKDLYVD